MDAWHRVSHKKNNLGALGREFYALTGYVPSRDDVNIATDELAAKIANMGREIVFSEALKASETTTQNFLSQWNAYVSDFNAWKSVWWLFVFGRRDELLAFRRRFNEMATAFEGLGGETVVQVRFSEAEISTSGAKDPPSKWHSTIKWVAAAGIVIGGAYVLTPAIKLFPSRKKAAA